MMILSAFGFALACYSAATLTGLSRTSRRAQDLDEPAALAATTGLVVLGWFLSFVAGAALIAFAATSRI
jgi:hypothetical protein